MSSRLPKKSTSAISDRVALKRSHTESFQAQVIAEQRKEIARLQRLLAKLEVKRHSEIESLKAKLAEEKKNKINVSIDRLSAA